MSLWTTSVRATSSNRPPATSAPTDDSTTGPKSGAGSSTSCCGSARRSRLGMDVTRPSRTKPQKVIPCASASSTARLDGAPTRPDETGQPVTADLWTGSNESRPPTERMES